MELHGEIVKVAKEIYEKNGKIEGRDLDNWLEAEKIVIARQKGQKKKTTLSEKISRVISKKMKAKK